MLPSALQAASCSFALTSMGSRLDRCHQPKMSYGWQARSCASTVNPFPHSQKEWEDGQGTGTCMFAAPSCCIVKTMPCPLSRQFIKRAMYDLYGILHIAAVNEAQLV